MLRCTGISKSYGNRQIFHDLNYHLASGIYAIQGRNGIGKSTLLGVLAGAIEADAGEVWINGISMNTSPLSARQRLSYVPDESPIYPFMSGHDLLDFVAMAKKNDCRFKCYATGRAFRVDPASAQPLCRHVAGHPEKIHALRRLDR